MNFSKITPAFIAGIVALMFLSSTASAQFTKTNANAYIYTGDRNIEVSIMEGMPPTVAVYAIIDLPIAFYVIYSANRYAYETLGAFQCNVEFTLLKSHSNGLYDFACVNADVFNENNSSTLEYNGTRYIQKF